MKNKVSSLKCGRLKLDCLVEGVLCLRMVAWRMA